MIKDTRHETAVVKVLHAGSLTSLVQRGVGPALLQESGITLESESGHSVALAMAIKDRSTSGDVFMSADAQVNQILLGAINSEANSALGEDLCTNARTQSHSGHLFECGKERVKKR